MKNILAPAPFIAFVLACLSSYCFAEEPVFRDVANMRPIWCGNSLFFASSRGLYSAKPDINKTQTSRVLSSAYLLPTGCSHDGRWLIYLDKRSVRWDKGNLERGVVDVWRYRLRDGVRQKFAIVEDGGPSAIPAPNKDAVFIGKPPKTIHKMPEPIWEIITTKDEHFSSGAIWMRDSGAVATAWRTKLIVENIADGSVAYADLGNLYRKIWKTISLSSNEILVLAEPPGKGPGKRVTVIAKCQSFLPSKCVDYVGLEFNATDFDISANADVYFTSGALKCIAKMTRKGEPPKCVYSGGGDNLAVSPNGVWLAFTRLDTTAPNHARDDLYVVPLTSPTTH